MSKEEKNVNLIFKDHSNIGRSILTEWDAEDEIKENSPVSIWSISKKYNLDPVIVCSSTFLTFISNYKQSQKLNKQLIFGIEFYIVENARDLSEDSLLTESKIQIYMKNSAGYKDLIKLYSACNANKDTFYYNGRLDFQTLQDYWTDNLILNIGFYDSFLHKNLLTHKARCIPNFGKIKPVFSIEPLHDLPFDGLIEKTVLDYTKNNNFETIQSHTALYFRESDIDAYCVFRTIGQRTNFNKPNLRNFCSNKFSVETWLNNQNIKL